MSLKQTYYLRNFCKDDAKNIATIDMLSMLSYMYNPDYKPENIFCAVEKSNIIGFAHISPEYDWNNLQDDTCEDFVIKYNICLVDNSNITLKNDLLNSLIKRARELKQLYPHKNLVLNNWFDSTNIDELSYYLSSGFQVGKSCFVMKYDLSKELKVVNKPNGIFFEPLSFADSDNLNNYHRVLRAVFNCQTQSKNYFNWAKNGPERQVYGAYHNNNLVASITTWRISENHSATEDIFVVPSWRNKGLAKYMVIDALKQLKQQGKSSATLSVFTDNSPAIKLYESLGYEIDAVMLGITMDCF